MAETIAAASGFHHIALGAVGSTNDEALARAGEGVPLPLWVTAERQLKGRGRLGAEWASEPGNLYASLVLQLDAPRNLPQLPLVAAVALHDALSERLAVAARHLAIKWPNDILFAGRKISGILAESQTGRDRSTVAVVGMGVNLAHHPPATRYPATDLAGEGIVLGPLDLFAGLDRAMAGRLSDWDGGREDGFRTIRDAWLDRVYGLGEPIEVRLQAETLSGLFEGMDEAGRLLLRRRDGEVRPVSAGEVFFPDLLATGGPN
jgi:BirA family biotin operon repressor/biotin-[acetyl-CoA-carboxylase] ligase